MGRRPVMPGTAGCFSQYSRLHEVYSNTNLGTAVSETSGRLHRKSREGCIRNPGAIASESCRGCSSAHQGRGPSAPPAAPRAEPPARPHCGGRGPPRRPAGTAAAPSQRPAALPAARLQAQDAHHTCTTGSKGSGGGLCNALKTDQEFRTPVRASTEHDGQQATAARLVSHGKPPVNRRASYGKPPVNRRASYGKPPVNRRASYGKPSVNRRAQTRRRRSGQVHNGGRMCQMHASKFISMLEKCLFKKTST